MGEKIRLFMEDWLFNSGLVGFYNILNHSEDEVLVKDNYIEFDAQSLIGFEEKYFSYLISKYKDILSINKIVTFKQFIDYYEDNSYEEFNEDSLGILNEYISKVLKKQLKSNSYKSAYKLVNSPIDLLEMEKKLKPIRIRKGQTLLDVLEEVKDKIKTIKKTISYMEQEESIKYIGAKNVMYTVIKNGWNGVSFLNPQTKEKDMYIDYNNQFIKPAIEYLETDRSKFKFKCYSCGQEMKNFSNDLSFMNATGFDTNRKTSHVWNFQNDVAVCPLCKLIYSCVPAGITYLYDTGIYINDNTNMKSAIDTNKKIYMETYKQNTEAKMLTYRSLVEAINEKYIDRMKHELADIQLVRYENEKYKFNILSRNALRLIRDSKKDLDKLTRCSYKEVSTYFNVYELVIDRLLNNQNMFTLIQKLLYYKISQPRDSYYHASHIIRILKINTKYLREAGYMDKEEKDIVRLGNVSGYYLRNGYRDKGAVDKLSGISYRLLNSLKTNNPSSFMDTVLNCYLYIKAPVPNIFLDTLRNEESFKTIGYAFVAGLIEGNNEMGGKADDK